MVVGVVEAVMSRVQPLDSIIEHFWGEKEYILSKGRQRQWVLCWLSVGKEMHLLPVLGVCQPSIFQSNPPGAF